MQEYISAKEVARVLSLSTKGAVSWLKRQGLNPIFLGRGRGMGWRWNKLEVEAAINGSIIIQQDETRKSRKPPSYTRPLVGKSIKEQLASILGK